MITVDWTSNREQRRCDGCEHTPSVLVVFGSGHSRAASLPRMRLCRMCARDARTTWNALPVDMKAPRKMKATAAVRVASCSNGHLITADAGR